MQILGPPVGAADPGVVRGRPARVRQGRPVVLTDRVRLDEQVNGSPGERTAYHPGYYGAYTYDPDGNNVEVVNHNRAMATAHPS